MSELKSEGEEGYMSTPTPFLLTTTPTSPQSILNPKFLYPFQLLRPLQTMNLKPTVYPPNYSTPLPLELGSEV